MSITAPPKLGRWLWLAVGGTLVVQLYLCFFFSFGRVIPITSDLNPANYDRLAFRFPPAGHFASDYWLGAPVAPEPVSPTSLLSHLPAWMFFSGYYPLFAALATLGFFWFLRTLGLGFWPALVAGLAYGWQGPMLSNIYGGHFSPVAMLALAPCAAALSLQSMRLTGGAGIARAVGAGALTGWMVTLQPDQGGLMACLIGVLFLAGVGERLARRATDWTRPLGRLAVTVTMAVLTALPTLQAMRATQFDGVRQGGSDDPLERWEWATQWSFPPEQVIEYLAPGVMGWGSGFAQGPYWGRVGRSAGWEETKQGFRNFSISTWPFGTVAFLLTCAGLAAVARRPEPGGATDAVAEQRLYGWLFIGVGAACLLFALGKFAPFYQLVYALPGMKAWRNPTKFLAPANFCLIALAGFGCQALLAALREPAAWRSFSRRFSLLTLAVAAGLAVGWLAWLGSGAQLAALLTAQGYRAEELAAIQRTGAQALFVSALLAGAVWGGLRWLGAAAKSSPTALAGGLLAVLIVGQMIWVQRQYLKPFDFRAAYQSNDLIEKLRSADAPARVKVIAQDGLLHHYLSTLFPYHGIASIDTPAASRVPEDYAVLFEALGQHPQRLWQLGGVRYFATPTRLAEQLFANAWFKEQTAAVYGYQASGQSLDNLRVAQVAEAAQATHLVIEFKDYLAKATFVPGAETFATQDVLVARLAAPNWDPRRTVLLDQPIALPPATPATATVQLRRYTPTQIDVTVESTAPGWLLINDRFDPRWQATVNGQPATPTRANLILTALPVTAGTSDITLRFRWPATAIYIQLAALALAALIVGGDWLRARRISDCNQPRAPRGSPPAS